MLHSVFGSNRPLVQVFLIIPTALGVVMAAWITTPEVHPLAGPPIAWLQNALLDYPAVGFVIGGVLYLFSAYLANNVYNSAGFGGRESYFPALVYVVLSLSIPDWTYLHPVLWANFFILLALRRLLMMYRVRSALAMLFDASVFMGLAIICYPPTLVVLPLVWLALMRFRTFDLREFLVPFTGLIFVGIYVFAAYFLTGQEPDFRHFFDLDSFDTSAWLLRGGAFFYPFVLLTALSTLGGVLVFILRMRTSTLHMKSTKTLFLQMTFLLVAAFVYSVFLDVGSPGAVMLLYIPVSAFTGVFFSRRRMQTWMLLIFYLWIVAALGFAISAHIV